MRRFRCYPAPLAHLVDDSGGVYTAPDSSGYGKLLAAGSKVDSIELTQKVLAGTYKAMTVWRPVLASDHSKPAGHISFAWMLTFEYTAVTSPWLSPRCSRTLSNTDYRGFVRNP